MEEQALLPMEFWGKIRIYKEYDTHNNGRVRILKQPGDIQKHLTEKQPGHITATEIWCRRGMEKYSPHAYDEFINISEIIFPVKKTAKTTAERKRVFDKKQKKKGRKAVTANLTALAYEILTEAQEATPELNQGDILSTMIKKSEKMKYRIPDAVLVDEIIEAIKANRDRPQTEQHATVDHITALISSRSKKNPFL